MTDTRRTILDYLADLMQDPDAQGATQDQLKSLLLHRYGVQASQASVSRALKRLGLVRAAGRHWRVEHLQHTIGGMDT